MLIFYKFEQKSTMYWIIISSEILGPHLVWAPRIAGAAGAVVTPLNHINYIENKIAKNVGIIKRVRYLLSEKTLNTLYNTLVLPYINYCNIIWANNKPTRLQPLLLLQKRCMRVITNSPYSSHSSPLFAKLNQLTITDINKVLIATFMYRYHSHCLPNIFVNYFCTKFFCPWSFHSIFKKIAYFLCSHWLNDAAITDMWSKTLELNRSSNNK